MAEKPIPRKKLEAAANALIEVARNAAEQPRARMAEELRIYYGRNYAADNGARRVGPLKVQVNRSLYNKTRAVTDAAVAWLVQTAGRIQYRPNPGEEEKASDVQVVEDWIDTYESTTESYQTALWALWGCTAGMGVRKLMWDTDRDMLWSPNVNPKNMSYDPNASDPSLNDAAYLVHSTRRSGAYLKQEYKGLNKLDDDGHYDHHELWAMPWAIPFMKNEELWRIVVVDDKLVVDKERGIPGPTPFWFPDFPFSIWRCMHVIDGEWKAAEMFGHGYPHLMFAEQTVIDELVANLLVASRGVANGQLLTTKDAMPQNRVLPIDGLILELNEGKQLSDVLPMPQGRVEPVLLDMLNLMLKALEDKTGINEVWKGTEPFSGVSGKAVQLFQDAARGQATAIVKAFMDARLRAARRKAALVQQLATRPNKLHAWRNGVDLGSFPMESRFVGIDVNLPDINALPQDAAGKLSFVQVGLGLQPDPVTGERFMTVKQAKQLVNYEREYGVAPAEDREADAQPLLPGIEGLEQLQQAAIEQEDAGA